MLIKTIVQMRAGMAWTIVQDACRCDLDDGDEGGQESGQDAAQQQVGQAACVFVLCVCVCVCV